MDGHYISFKLENDEENELLRVYPVELRRTYAPESTERTTEIAGFEVGVMQMAYKLTDCIVRLRTKSGPKMLSDGIGTILDEYEVVTATFMPADITISIGVDEEDLLKKQIFYFFPDILTTNKYGRHNLIDLDRTMPDTVHARSRGAHRIPEVTAIPMMDTNAAVARRRGVCSDVE